MVHPKIVRRCVPLVAPLVFLVGCAIGPSQQTDDPVVFSSQRSGGTEDLLSLDLLTGHTELLVPGDSVSSRSLGARSPDGRDLAYVRELGSYTEVYVAESDGRAPRRIGQDLPPVALFPAWSRDGAELLVSAGPSHTTLGVYRVDVDDGVSQEVISPGTGLLRCPSWSPRGGQFVVAQSGGSRSSLVIHSLDGSAPDTLLTTTTSHLDCPDWSPDGREIVFTRYHIPANQLFELNSLTDDGDLEVWDLAAGAARTLVDDPGITNYGKWSPSGEWVVFQSARDVSGATSESEWFAGLEIYRVRRDGSGLERLTTNRHFDAHPNW